MSRAAGSYDKRLIGLGGSIVLLIGSLCAWTYGEFSIGDGYYTDRMEQIDGEFTGRVNRAVRVLKDLSIRDEVGSLLFRAELEKRVLAADKLLEFQEANPQFDNIWLSDKLGNVISALEFNRRSVAALPAFQALRSGDSRQVWVEEGGLQIAVSVYDFDRKFYGVLAARFVPQFAGQVVNRSASWLHRSGMEKSGLMIYPHNRRSLLVFPGDMLSASAKLQIWNQLKYTAHDDSGVMGIQTDGREYTLFYSGQSNGLGGKLVYIEESKGFFNTWPGWLTIFSAALTMAFAGLFVYDSLHSMLGRFDRREGEWVDQQLESQKQQVEALLEKTAEVLNAYKARETDARPELVDDSDERRYQEAKIIDQPGATPAQSAQSAQDTAKTAETARAQGAGAQSADAPPAAAPKKPASPAAPSATDSTPVAPLASQGFQQTGSPGSPGSKEGEAEGVPAEAVDASLDEVRERIQRKYAETKMRLDNEFIELHRVNREFIYLNPFEQADEDLTSADREFVFEVMPEDLDPAEPPLREPYLFDEPARTPVDDAGAQKTNIQRDKIFTDDLREQIRRVAGHAPADSDQSEQPDLPSKPQEQPAGSPAGTPAGTPAGKPAADGADQPADSAAAPQADAPDSKAAATRWASSEVEHMREAVLASVEQLMIPDIELRSELARAYRERTRERDIVQQMLAQLAGLVQAQSAALLYFHADSGCYQAGLSYGLADAEKANLYFAQLENLLKSESFFRVVPITDGWKENESFAKRFDPYTLERLSAIGVINLNVYNERSYVLLFFSGQNGNWAQREQIWTTALKAYIYEFVPLIKSRERRILLPREVHNFNTRIIHYLKLASESYSRPVTIAKFRATNFFDKKHLPGAARLEADIEDLVLRTLKHNEYLVRIGPDRMMVLLRDTDPTSLAGLVEELNQGFFNLEFTSQRYPDKGLNFYNYL